MGQPVTIQNDAISMEVWPSIGGKVGSIIDKTDKFDLLFNFPNELPTAACYDTPYELSWYGGWDECFPAVAPSRYPGRPYDGIAVPDHGELWGLPTTAVPSKDGITTVWHGLRFGYRLVRKLELDGASIRAEYTLVNLAPFEFRFVWAAHPLMTSVQPIHLRMEEGADFRLSHESGGGDVQQPFKWPSLDGRLDFSKFEELPSKGAWKLYSQQPIARGLTIEYPTRGRSVTVEYESDSGVQAYWGIWINTGGWGGHKHFAVEPTTGRYDQIDRAVRDGSAGKLEAMQKCQWSVRWTLA